MRIPRSIDILGSKWKIKRQKTEDEDYWGLCEHEEKTIYIHPDCPKDQLDQVLLHELGHALIDELRLHNTSFSIDVEEIIVEHFAVFMLKNFRISLKRG